MSEKKDFFRKIINGLKENTVHVEYEAKHYPTVNTPVTRENPSVIKGTATNLKNLGYNLKLSKTGYSK